MRVFELSTHVKSISRKDGRSATAAAAYRSCSAITDERQGRTHDFTRKRGLEVAAIVLPAYAPAWALDRAQLWNAAELVERNGKRGKNAGQFKADAVTAREFLFSFPVELSAPGRLMVAHTLARHLADTHGIAADFAIHHPGAEGDERNYHCHLLTTTRRLTAEGLTKKAREWSSLKLGAALARSFRALIAKTMNEALAAEGKGGLVHVEHRSFKARGSSQVATRHQGPTRTSINNKRARQLRAAWERDNRRQQLDRHGVELTALKSRHDASLAAKLADLAERRRHGIAAIRAELARAQAADVSAKGTRRLFEVATGNAMRADFDRQTRAAQRIEAADQQIAALKAGLDAERAAYARTQAGERAALVERHGKEDQQMRQAVTARTAFDRAAMVEQRRQEALEIARDRRAHDGPAPHRSS